MNRKAHIFYVYVPLIFAKNVAHCEPKVFVKVGVNSVMFYAYVYDSLEVHETPLMYRFGGNQGFIILPQPSVSTYLAMKCFGVTSN